MADDTKKNQANGGNAGTPGGASSTAPKSEEMVQVPVSTLQEIMATLKDNKEKIEGLEKGREEDAELLRTVADKARLQKWDDARKDSLISTARIAFWKDAPIVGWKMKTDEVGFRDGKLHVKQEIEVFTQPEENGKVVSEVIEYIFWAQNVDMKVGELVEKSESNEGQFWTVRMQDGRKVKLDIRFLNAF